MVNQPQNHHKRMINSKTHPQNVDRFIIGFTTWVADKICLLLAMDIAKVGGPLSVVKVATQVWTSQVPPTLVFN
jgi:hypothetical protein